MRPDEAAPAAGETFSFPDFFGELLSRHRPRDVEAAVRRLVDPGTARRTLHWGRNYLYAVDLETAAATVPVVVKQFRNSGFRARLRRRFVGSKAASSWRAATRLLAAGVGTPEPIMLIESTQWQGPSLYVCREVEGFKELRYLLRAMREGRQEELYPGCDEKRVLVEVGRFLRRVHDAGIWHRDVSIGNVLLSHYGEGDEPLEILILDLDRARLRRRLSVLHRTRDLVRLPLLDGADRRAFLDAYWGDRVGRRFFKRLLFAAGVRGFLARNRIKALVRAPAGKIYRLLTPRRAHAHIPPAPEGARARDKAVWDHLSDQPHQHAGRWEQLREYLADTGIHFEALAQGLAAAPRIHSAYRRLHRGLHATPHAWGGVGVGLRPRPEAPGSLLSEVDALGVANVLLRLHPWEEEHQHEAALAAELAGRGLELTFTLPQNRELVTDRRRWRDSIERIAEIFVPYGRHFQVGQAVNRSKWGIWNYHEYLELAAEASEILRARGDIEILGPAVIDFEFYATVSLLNMAHAGTSFDGLASLLYVDRRGAPENRQLGFDTIDKVVLMKAIATASNNCGEGSWITEFNWPLWEGPHSPAGRTVSVDEEAQADYLARFYLLALGTGLVERAFWWQVVAKGYGLVEPDAGRLRRRPAFLALANLERLLRGARVERPLAAPAGAHLYHFTRPEEDLVVGWSAGEPCRARLPRRASLATGRDGEELPRPDGVEVELGSSPRYYRLER